jgi:DNA-binding XRE family transcriptional regulator
VNFPDAAKNFSPNILTVQIISLNLQITSMNNIMPTNSINIDTERINRIKVVLVEQNRTGKWLAEQLGKNEATVSRWCSNSSQPSLEMLVSIASILNVDPRELITGKTVVK